MDILKVKDLAVSFSGRNVVDGVSFDIRKGEVFGIVGGSGSGKTMTALSVMGLVPYPGKIAAGEIIFKGDNLPAKNDAYLRDLRGKKVSMVFQDPSAAFNPVFTIGYQIVEAVLAHSDISYRDARALAIDYLGKVNVADPKRVYGEYPHRLSGGTKQRAMIAMALINKPDLVILDEPTSSLDVTVQAQVLGLIEELIKTEGLTALFISHDFGIISRMCDRVGVMRSGKILESGDTEELLRNPKDSYTVALLESVKALA